jgi:lysophospholipase L1-like esterase
MVVGVAVLGDSIAHGQGASKRVDSLAERLRRGLEELHEVEIQVFAVRGARSADLAGQVEQAARWSPDVAVIVIGANDLTHRVSAVTAAEALGRAVRALRRQGAEVVVAPAPNLSVVPHVPDQLRAVVGAASRRLRSLQVEAVQTAGGAVADADEQVASRFAQDRSLFSADLFHPSSAGYAVIAEALLPDVRAAVGLVVARRAQTS